jgi:hypothetical protein
MGIMVVGSVPTEGDTTEGTMEAASPVLGALIEQIATTCGSEIGKVVSLATLAVGQSVLEICPRGNNKVVIIISLCL